VTYADVWEFWLRSPKLADAVDFVTIHILPYWEDIPISADKAADHVASLHKRVSQAFPGRTILLGEVGWPSAGRMREGARPSPANQARVLAEVIARAHAENFPINVIESFDQPWKRFFEGTVGGHWGFMDAVSRAPKFAWGSPVSNHPQWKLWAALGAAFACLVLGAALFMERQMGAAASSAGRWGGVAIVATTAGLLAGLAGEAAQVESFALGGVLRSLALCTLVLIAPLVAAGTLMRFHSVPSFARILARMAERPNDPLDRLAGCTLVAATVIAVQAALGFVFDPRYRDFPNAPMTVVVVSFGVLWIFGKPRRGVRPLAETGAAILLALSAIFIAINETFANWQALWFCAAAVGLAAILTAVRDAPG
jgi:glucan 1,3-beta-glucosidase